MSLGRGIAFGALRRYKEEIASYDKAIDINPDLEGAWYNRGNTLVLNEQYTEALDSYDKVITLNPNNSDAWHKRGEMLSKLNEYAEAVASYDKAIAINPNFAKLWYGRGKALDELRRYEEAVISYDKAIAINPDFEWAWDRRGIALSRLNRFQEAAASHDKAKSIKSLNKKKKEIDELKKTEDALLLNIIDTFNSEGAIKIFSEADIDSLSLFESLLLNILVRGVDPELLLKLKNGLEKYKKDITNAQTGNTGKRAEEIINKMLNEIDTSLVKKH